MVIRFDSYLPDSYLFLMRSRRRLHITIASVIFISGMIAGGWAMMLFFEYRLFREPPKPDSMAVKLSLEMQKAMHLSDEQTRSIMSVLFLEFSAIDRIRLDHQSQMETRHQIIAEQLREILTPRQFTLWQKKFQPHPPKGRIGFPAGPPQPQPQAEL